MIFLFHVSSAYICTPHFIFARFSSSIPLFPYLSFIRFLPRCVLSCCTLPHPNFPFICIGCSQCANDTFVCAFRCRLFIRSFEIGEIISNPFGPEHTHTHAHNAIVLGYREKFSQFHDFDTNQKFLNSWNYAKKKRSKHSSTLPSIVWSQSGRFVWLDFFALINQSRLLVIGGVHFYEPVVLFDHSHKIRLEIFATLVELFEPFKSVKSYRVHSDRCHTPFVSEND